MRVTTAYRWYLRNGEWTLAAVPARVTEKQVRLNFRHAAFGQRVQLPVGQLDETIDNATERTTRDLARAVAKATKALSEAEGRWATFKDVTA